MKFRDRDKVAKHIAMSLGSGVEIQDKSTPSYVFKKSSRNEKVNETLCRFFDIPETEAFKTAYDQVASGQGNESENLLTIHSSALLALLCFYRVEAGNSLSIECDGTLYEFDKVFFEVENIVIDPHDRPSSIDVALYSTKNKVLLLLESKFTEPINGSNLKDIGEKYFNRLKLLSKSGIRFIDKTHKFDCAKVTIGKRERLIYYDGIKQMIAHLIGAETGPVRLPDGKKVKQEKYATCFDEAQKIYLGCILVNDSDLFEKTEYEMISNYIELYEQSMTILTETIEGQNKGRLHLLTKPMTYQEVFANEKPKYRLPEKIMKF
ncbi:MAG: hypothetical protein K2F98_03840, partial [Bacteroides sp.]|nr:hypothetical protein [Bacteroides sp.]